jgi:hypothetical protein
MTSNIPMNDHRPEKRLVCRIGMLTAAVALGAASVAAAQPGAGLDGRGSLLRTFEANAPAVGERMPNLPVFDRDGQESRLPALLDGRVTVLILGCLT